MAINLQNLDPEELRELASAANKLAEGQVQIEGLDGELDFGPAVEQALADFAAKEEEEKEEEETKALGRETEVIGEESVQEETESPETEKVEEIAELAGTEIDDDDLDFPAAAEQRIVPTDIAASEVEGDQRRETVAADVAPNQADEVLDAGNERALQLYETTYGSEFDPQARGAQDRLDRVQERLDASPELRELPDDEFEQRRAAFAIDLYRNNV